MSWSSPYPLFPSNVVVPCASIASRCRTTICSSSSGPAARVARVVERIPPPAASSSSYVAPRCPQRELVRPIAGERGVGVAVDEAGHRGDAPTVDLLDIAVQPSVSSRMRPTASIDLAADEDVRVLDD